MDTSKEKNTSLTEAIKCNICLEQLCNPKMLACCHSFCKECLDHLIQWDHIGSGTIVCPLRCDNVNRITQTQTTNDLPSSYNLQGVIDALLESTDSTSHMCLAKEQCGSVIQRSCKSCSCKTCKGCWGTHKCSDVDVTRNERFGNGGFGTVGFTAVTYDMKTLSFQPYCEEHSSIADSICKYCTNSFICVYCKHRSHKGHGVVSIRDSAEIIRKRIDSKVDAVKKKEKLPQIIKHKYLFSKHFMRTSRNELVKELENRKFKKVVKLLEILTEKERDILKIFDSEVQKFDEEFAELGVLDDDKKIEAEIKYFQDVKVKDDFSIVEMEEVLESKMNKLCFSTIPSLKLHFTSMREELLSLGQLYVKPHLVGILNTNLFENDFIRVDMNGIYSAAAKELKRYPLLMNKFDLQHNRGTPIRFQNVAVREMNNVYTTQANRSQCITFMDEYAAYSVEELRLVDYAVGRKGVGSIENNSRKVIRK